MKCLSVYPSQALINAKLVAPRTVQRRIQFSISAVELSAN